MSNHKDLSSLFSIKCFYPKGMHIFDENELCTEIGYIHQGELHLTHFSYQGNDLIVSKLTKGDIFGDFLIHSSNPFYPGHLVAASDCEISFMSKKELNDQLDHNQSFRNFYLRNLSNKAMQLNLHQKILLQNNLRDKILMWLSYHVKTSDHKAWINSKEALSKYLNVARPSLSRELAQMKQEGLLDYDKKVIWMIR